MSIRDCPTRLYKYFAPERVDVLEQGLMRYSPLGAFNDPFEGRPEITDLSTHVEATRIIDETVHNTIRESYALLPEEKKQIITFEVFSNFMLGQFQERKNEFFREVQSFTPLVKSHLSQKFDELIGACCLSEVPDSLLMWSHYGASHTGFVIEFNAHHAHFHAQKAIEDELRHLRRVLYRENRPSAPLSRLDAVDMFLVKSGHWAYEREWRILRALSDATKTIPCSPYPIHLFQFPQEAVDSVILGSRIRFDTAERIRNAIKQVGFSKDVKLKKAIPDESHFLLRIREQAF